MERKSKKITQEAQIGGNPTRIGERFGEICTHFFDGSVGEFANKCNVDVTNMSKIINGSKDPKIDTTRVLAALPQVNARWLLFGTGTMLDAAVNQQINGDVNAPAIAGNGNTTTHQSAELSEALELLKEKDVQMNRLITIIEQLSSK